MTPSLAELLAELGVTDPPCALRDDIDIIPPARPAQPTISLVEAYEAARQSTPRCVESAMLARQQRSSVASTADYLALAGWFGWFDP